MWKQVGLWTREKRQGELKSVFFYSECQCIKAEVKTQFQNCVRYDLQRLELRREEKTDARL